MRGDAYDCGKENVLVNCERVAHITKVMACTRTVLVYNHLHFDASQKV